MSRGHVARKSKRWYPVVNLGEQPAVRCVDCGRRQWVEDERPERCEKCGSEVRDTQERRQRWHPGHDRKRDATDELTRILGQLRDGVYVQPTRQTLAQYFDQWAEGAAVNLRDATLDKYRRDFDRYLRRRIGGTPLQKLTPSRLNALYAELLREGGRDGRSLSATTVAHVHALLNKVLSDAVDEGAVVRNVAQSAKPPKMPRPADRELTVWSPEEIRRFLAGVADDRLAALWRVYAVTGCRRGEALGMKWSDLDLDAGRWAVSRSIGATNGRPTVTPPKTATGRRVVALDATTVAALREHRKTQLEDRMAAGAGYVDEGWVFCHEDGRPLHPNVVTKRFVRTIKRLGLPRIRLHDLRHSAVSAMLAAGTSTKAVAERVGHASTSFTMDTYASVLPHVQDSAAAQIASAIDG